MFILHADKNQLTVYRKEPITSGSVNVYTAQFEFSPDWDGLTRKAVFKGSGNQISVLLDESGQCTIPREVLASHGQLLKVGVFGTRDEMAFPTVWANLGMILEGATEGGATSKPPAPGLTADPISLATEQEVNEMLNHVFGAN